MRIQAIREIGEKRINNAVPLLLRMYRTTKHTIVKKTIIRALSRIRDRRSIPLLYKTILSYQKNTFQRYAMQAVKGWRNKKIIKALIYVASNASLSDISELAHTTLTGMGKFAVPQILQALKKAGYTDTMLISILGNIKDRRAVPYILKGLKRSDSFPGNYLNPLKKIGDKSCFPELARIYGNYSKGSYYKNRVIGKALLFFSKNKSITVFKQNLQSKMEGIRLLNAELLILSGKKQGLRFIRKLAGDPRDHSLVRRAIEILGELRDRDSVPLISKVLLNHNDYYTRSFAAKALKIIADKKSVPSLIKALSQTYYNTVWHTLAALCRIRDRRAVPAIMKTAAFNYGLVRKKVAEVLAIFKDPRSIQVLAKLLQDKEYMARKFAAKGLVRIGKKAADYLWPQLTVYLVDNKNKQAKRVLSVLGNLKDKRIIPVIIRILQQKKKPLLFTAAKICGEMKVQAAFKYLLPYLETKNPYILRQVIYAVGVLGGKKALPLIKKQMQHKDYYVRDLLVDTLALIPGKESALLLTTMLNDKSFIVRKTATTALKNHRYVFVKAALQKRLLTEKQLYVRIPLMISLVLHGEKQYYRLILKEAGKKRINNDDYMTALGRLGGSSAYPVFIKKLESPSYTTRAEAARLLGNYGSKQAVPILIRKLKDKEQSVVINAVQALGMLGDKRALLPLRNMIKQHDSLKMIEALERAIGPLL